MAIMAGTVTWYSRAIAFPKPPSGQVGEDCIVGVVFESAEWEPVREGDVIPTMMPWFERAEITANADASGVAA